MCGIVGIAAARGSEKITSMLDSMAAAIFHRGPDAGGCWATENFGFAMRRLSIIDLSGGQQPMWTHDGVGIVFNGEVYNYKQLRSQLLANRYQFDTHSDTEVVLKAFHQSGISSIYNLNGMFSFCIYDGRSNSFFLVRDRVGIKPLYYGTIDGVFYFASELKAILAVLPKRPRLNEQAVIDFLTFRYVPGPQTIWEGIYKLPPGSYLQYDLSRGSVDIREYWRWRVLGGQKDGAGGEVARFADLFRESVDLQMVAADVPVGVLLSGGLDSSAVAVTALESGHKDFHTFSVGFRDGGNFSELAYAKTVANHIKSQHHEITIGQKEFLDFLPELVWWTDEPLADLASVPLYYVARLARQYVKVVMSGEGSDEVLAGYDFEKQAARVDKIRKLLRCLPLSVVRRMAVLPFTRWKNFFSSLSSGLPNYYKSQTLHMPRYWRDDEKKNLCLSLKDGWRASDALIASWYLEAKSLHPIEQSLEVQAGSWLVEDLLMKADKMTMANSLELRVPFLDHRLVEFANSLPLQWKVGSASDGYSSKRILRLYSENRLPKIIINRPKQGFPVPAYVWLQKNNYSGWADDFLAGKKTKLANLFDISIVKKTFDLARGGDILAAHKIWSCIILELWMRKWL